MFDGPTERLLGAQMVSYAGAELIQLLAVAIRVGADALEPALHPPEVTASG